jgi:hypothetical protein
MYFEFVKPKPIIAILSKFGSSCKIEIFIISTTMMTINGVKGIEGVRSGKPS